MLHVVIMAGGGGTRLWPLSTPDKPKQFLDFAGDRSLLAATVDRVAPLIPAERRWIVTVEEQVPLIEGNALELPRENVIREPMGRNTAPCIGLAALRVLQRDPEALLAILPADHLIRDETGFQRKLETAAEAAKKHNAIVTIGIEPTRPETGYGYIRRGAEELEPGVWRVDAFKEKPDADTAAEYIATGKYLWNAGMFIVPAKRMYEDIARFLPGVHEGLEKMRDLEAGDEAYARRYAEIESISIDYGVIERADNVLVVPADIGWSDVGGYQELHRVSDRDEQDNAVDRGRVYTDDVTGAYIRSELDIPLAVIGVKDVVVVATHKGILVCDREQAQKVKQAQAWAKGNN